MKVLNNLVAFAHHNLLVTAVKMTDVILIYAKIMEPVLLVSLTKIQHQNAFVQQLIMEPFVTC